MKILISGHRKHKLENYDIDFIKESIEYILFEHVVEGANYITGLSGMADGVDLWFCKICNHLQIPYIACVPFDGQDVYMSKEDKEERANALFCARETKFVKNSWMVEHCDRAIIVWDGNKGGTHNVLQQLIENKKPFYWINPVNKKIYPCL